MITSFNPNFSRARIANNNKAVSFEARLTTKDIEKIKSGKNDASFVNTIIGQIGANYYTKEENKVIMEKLTKDHGGNPIVHIINGAFGFNFPK